MKYDATIVGVTASGKSTLLRCGRNTVLFSPPLPHPVGTRGILACTPRRVDGDLYAACDDTDLDAAGFAPAGARTEPASFTPATQPATPPPAPASGDAF